MLIGRRKEIKKLVNNTQRELLANVGDLLLLSEQEKTDAFDVISYLGSLGFSVHEIEDIPGGANGSNTIGRLDKTISTIYIKSNISQERKLFTLAHELAHILMHKNMDVMHREVDRKFGQKRPELEEEADYFASCWLMPRLLVIKRFKERFLCAPITFSDAIAFHLSNNDEAKQELLEATKKSGIKELALSKGISFNRKSFESLASCFKVSNEAMAYRLQELKLVTHDN